MLKDDNISDLIKEAKPLYFAKKKRKKALASSLAMLIIAYGINFHTPSSDYIYDFDGLNEEIYLTQTGSSLENYDLPIDEYGFLEVV